MVKNPKTQRVVLAKPEPESLKWKGKDGSLTPISEMDNERLIRIAGTAERGFLHYHNLCLSANETASMFHKFIVEIYREADSRKLGISPAKEITQKILEYAD